MRHYSVSPRYVSAFLHLTAHLIDTSPPTVSVSSIVTYHISVNPKSPHRRDVLAPVNSTGGPFLVITYCYFPSLDLGLYDLQPPIVYAVCFPAYHTSPCFDTCVVKDTPSYLKCAIWARSTLRGNSSSNTLIFIVVNGNVFSTPTLSMWGRYFIRFPGKLRAPTRWDSDGRRLVDAMWQIRSFHPDSLPSARKC